MYPSHALGSSRGRSLASPGRAMSPGASAPRQQVRMGRVFSLPSQMLPRKGRLCPFADAFGNTARRRDGVARDLVPRASPSAATLPLARLQSSSSPDDGNPPAVRARSRFPLADFLIARSSAAGDKAFLLSFQRVDNVNADASIPPVSGRRHLAVRRGARGSALMIQPADGAMDFPSGTALAPLRHGYRRRFARLPVARQPGSRESVLRRETRTRSLEVAGGLAALLPGLSHIY